jgi:hypothetical protein
MLFQELTVPKVINIIGILLTSKNQKKYVTKMFKATLCD